MAGRHAANCLPQDIHWPDRTISFQRCKSKVPVVIAFGAEAAAVLQTLPRSGLLFPWLSGLHEKHRAKHFIKRLATLSIGGVRAVVEVDGGADYRAEELSEGESEIGRVGAAE
jgi:hypothetical protein